MRNKVLVLTALLAFGVSAMSAQHRGSATSRSGSFSHGSTGNISHQQFRSSSSAGFQNRGTVRGDFRGGVRGDFRGDRFRDRDRFRGGFGFGFGPGFYSGYYASYPGYPGPGYAWIDGYYDWNGYEYVW